MQMYFELGLTLIVVLSGLIWLSDALFFAKKRQVVQGKTPFLVDQAKAFFPVLLVVLLLRSFLAEPYRIPSGSAEPTLLVGDFIVANKFAYGLHLPISRTKILQYSEPKVGDIALLHSPVNPSENLIKRVIGTPGDHVSYINKVLYINGKEASQQVIGTATDEDNKTGQQWPVTVIRENLQGIVHNTYQRADIPAQDFTLTVPKHEYFVMGDNRDDSNDSRYWGFVPEANLIGKAYMVVFSWDGDKHDVRWQRIGTLAH